MTSLVLFSGGVDSSLAIQTVIEDVIYPISFDDGSTFYRNKERVAITQVLNYYGLTRRWIEVPFANTDQLMMWDGKNPHPFIAGWKLMMYTIALSHAHAYGAQRILTGYTNWNTHFEDELPAVIEQAACLYNTIYDTNIRFEHPFYEKDKSEIVDYGLAHRFPFQLTLSCGEETFGGLVHCGRCPLCKERKRAFRELPFGDPTEYASE